MKTLKMTEKDESDGNMKFPRAVILLIVFEYFVRFCYNSIQVALPLYLVDILKYTDDEATMFYHAFIAILLSFSIVGGIIADSFLGKFKSILFIGTIYSAGMFVLSASATQPFHLPVREFTILGLLFAAFGYGAIKPCAIAFGGHQFVLPQQAKQLPLLFVFLCMAENAASMSVAFVAPVLRKDITCFGQLTCYPLVFVVPGVLLASALVMIFVTKRFYRIDKPEGNVVVEITKCMFHAICQRFKAKEKQQHWLDYAKDKYESKLIEDIKSVSSIIKLVMSLTVFWSLFTAQSTFWIFQASRMDGEVGGYVIKPDQIMMASPISVIIFASIFHSYVSPFLAKFFWINTPLKRITFGCFVAAFSYIVSGVLEFNLERTYAKIPTEGLAQMRIYNTFNCNASVTIDQHNYVLNELDVWQKIDIPTSGKRVLKYEIDLSNCNVRKVISSRISGQLEVVEKQATSWGLTENGLDYKFIDHIDKSNSGNPLVRTLIDVNDDFIQDDFSLKLVSKGELLEKFKLPHTFMESEFKEIAHKIYDLYLNDQLVESDVPLKLGGVYTILGHVSNSSVDIRTVTVTQPNSLHIFWIVPQVSILAVAEIMVYALIMDFAYSQSPTSMKAFLQSLWLFIGLFGNLIVIVITHAHIFERKVFGFFLYAFLMIVSAIIFAILAKFYTYRKSNDNDPK